jgi:hypothetical protein
MLILKDMTHLPYDHPVWRWVNSTEAYCEITGVIPTHIQELNEFISWYNDQVEVAYELKQKTNLKNTTALDSPGDWGSSSSEPITWGKTGQINHEEELRLWNDVPKTTGLLYDEEPQVTLNSEHKQQGNESDSGEGNAEYKEDPFYYDPELTHLHADSKKLAREDRDDEQEFKRIPIAGEDSEDCNTSEDGED